MTDKIDDSQYHETFKQLVVEIKSTRVILAKRVNSTLGSVNK
jgi:hypothetical protein